MDNPLYMPKGWRAGSVRLQPTVAHEEGGVTYVKGFNGAGGGGGDGLVPVNATMVTSGDSITAGAFQQNNAQDRTYSSIGYIEWMLQAANHRLFVPYNGNLAVSGNTLQQIITSYGGSGATLNALNPAVVTFMGGTNNLNDTFTDGQLQGYYDTIFSLLTASPASLIVFVGITPRFAPAALTGAGETQRLMLNAYGAAKVAALGARAVYLDPDTLGLVTGDFADGLHPNASGAKKIGDALFALMDPKMAAGSIMNVVPPQMFTLNPTMAGGTTVATNWSSSGTASGVTATYSKDGTDRQRMQLSGTNATGSAKLSLDQYTNVTAVGQTPPAQSQIEGVLEYELVGVPTGVGTINLLVGSNTSGFANLGQGQSLGDDYVNVDIPVVPGVYRTRPISVQMAAGVPFYLTTRVIVALINGGTVSLDLRINRVEFRRSV